MTETRKTRLLSKYIRKVEIETSRKVIIFENKTLKPMTGFFKILPNIQEIIISVSPKHKNDSQKDWESLVAHELTHARLIYGMGFYAPVNNEKFCSEYDKYSTIKIHSAIEDIVVNRIIQREEFYPIPEFFIQYLTKAVYAAHDKNKDFYNSAINHTQFRDNQMILDYVYLWGHLTFCKLKREHKNTISDFLSVFNESYPDLFVKAKHIINEIVTNEFLEPEGNKKVMESVWDYFGLKYKAFMVITE